MKKFLSLVLALVMTMSLVTISASATEYKDFTDKDEIQYEEAVAVLNRLGIITGYAEGDFRPEGELTRGAAAKIIVSLLIGPETAENVSPTAAPYKDVPLDHTFAGPIAYCKTAGIISGYSDGSFQPGGTLTGYAFSKMLLGALGYDSTAERFTGAGWNMNVNARAAEAGLFDRISFKGNEPVNREQAAQLALNTLKATMVEYTGGFSVNVGDANVVGNQTRTYKISNQEYATHINNRKASQVGNATGDTHYTVEFGEEHFVDLRMTHDRNARDDFGRPSNEWSYKKVTIGTFPIAADKVYTTLIEHNVTTVTNATKARALELNGFKVNANTTVTINGCVDTSANLQDVGQIADYTDNGTQVEVYIDEDVADWVRDVVVVKSQLMEVKRLGKDSVSLDLYDNGSANKGKLVYGFNQVALDEKVKNVEIDDVCYTMLSGLKVSDLVVVVPVTTDGGRNYTVAEAYVPETVSGNLQKVTTFGNSATNVNTVGVTVGGAAYNVSLWNKDLVNIDGDKLKVTTKDVTLTLDKFGNTMLAKDVGATSNYMVVGSYYQSLINGKLMTFVKGWDISGEELELNLGSKYGDGYASINVPGDLVHYTNARTGDADWVLSDDHGVFRVYTGTDDTTTNDGYSIKTSNSHVKAAKAFSGTDDNPWIDKNIKFIYVTFNDDGDVDFIDIKNGVQAVSNTELKESNTKYTNSDSAQLSLKLKDGEVTPDSTVTAVVIKNEPNDAVASNMLYIVNYIGGHDKDENGNVIHEYTVAMNGSSGLVDDEMTIYSTRRLYRGDWARYTKVENENYDSFYRLTPVDWRARATSTMVANLKSYPISNNKSLVTLDANTLQAIDGKTLSGNTGDHALPNIKDATKNNLGIGDASAAFVVSLRNAVWVDLTGNGIDGYEDLSDFIDEGHRLSDVRVSMIFNDDPTKDSFRQVAMIVVQDVGSNVAASGLGVVTMRNANINSRGVFSAEVTVAPPAGVVGDAWVVTGTPVLEVYVGRSLIGTINVSVLTGDKGNLLIPVRITGADVDASDLDRISCVVNGFVWSTKSTEPETPPAPSKYAVTLNLPEGVTADVASPFDVAVNETKTVTLTAPEGTTLTATVEPAGNADLTTNDTTLTISGVKGAVTITVTAGTVPASMVEDEAPAADTEA